MVPSDVIWHIQTFMRWRHVAILVSKGWLRRALRKQVRLRSWRGQLRIFSYLKTFGPTFVGMSWSRFCSILYVRRRQRNKHFRLTWKAAAESCMKQNRCQACGRRSNANVFGISLCSTCRFNSQLKYTYMVKTFEAKRQGIPTRILKQVEHHRVGQAHLRFWHEIMNACRNDAL